MNEKFVEIINEMAEVLNASQLKRLQEVMLKHLVEREPQKRKISNKEYLAKFLEAKKMEGCSDRTIKYYRVTVEQLLKKVVRPVRRITTEE
ncbi:phage integrase N-terminal SAM-like domain-containing protein, partial [Limosilactobacillus reuteri]